MDPILQSVRQVRDNLHGFAQVVTLSLQVNYVLIYLPGGDVVVSTEGNIEVPLVVAEIEINFSTVVEYETLPMPAIVSTRKVVGQLSIHPTYSRGFISPASMFI